MVVFHHISFERYCVDIRFELFFGDYNKYKLLLFEEVGCIYLKFSPGVCVKKKHTFVDDGMEVIWVVL